MIERFVFASCLVASVTGLASAANLVNLGFGAVETGFEASFELLMLTCAMMQGTLAVLLVVSRSVTACLPFVMISVVPAGLRIFPPVPIRSIWDLISPIAFGLGVVTLVLIVVRNMIRMRRR